MDAESIYHLSKTEVKIIELLEKGLSNKSISIKCDISENTVKFHLKNIYKKLKVHNRLEAVCKINKNNL
jgi:DNA-binding NarL/FixJ family response regulator